MSSCDEAVPISRHKLIILMKGNMPDPFAPLQFCSLHSIGTFTMSEVDGWEIDRGVD